MFVVINMVAGNGLKGTKNWNTLCYFPLLQNRKPTMVKSTNFLGCKWNFGFRMFFYFQFQTIGNNTIYRFYPQSSNPVQPNAVSVLNRIGSVRPSVDTITNTDISCNLT